MSNIIDILLDPGHGGSDPGAIGPTGVKEKDCTLKITQCVGKILIDSKINVAYTRVQDISMSLQERSNMANKLNPLYFMSIHINSATNNTATGTETFAFSPGGSGEKLAQAVQKNLVANIKLPNRGVKFSNFHVLRETKMPAALTEVCFINNPIEENLLKTDGFIELVSRAIASGVMEVLGIKTPLPSQPDFKSHWAEQYWNYLNDNGVQITDKRYDDPLTRGEAFALLARVMQADRDS